MAGRPITQYHARRKDGISKIRYFYFWIISEFVYETLPKGQCLRTYKTLSRVLVLTGMHWITPLVFINCTDD